MHPHSEIQRRFYSTSKFKVKICWWTPYWRSNLNPTNNHGSCNCFLPNKTTINLPINSQGSILTIHNESEPVIKKKKTKTLFAYQITYPEYKKLRSLSKLQTYSSKNPHLGSEKRHTHQTSHSHQLTMVNWTPYSVKS